MIPSMVSTDCTVGHCGLVSIAHSWPQADQMTLDLGIDLCSLGRYILVPFVLRTTRLSNAFWGGVVTSPSMSLLFWKVLSGEQASSAEGKV